MRTYNFFTLHNIEVMHNDIIKYSNYKTAIKAIEGVGDNWRLPTINELGYLYNLHKLGIGDFSNDSSYWSSNRMGITGCEIIKMSSGYKGVASVEESLSIISTRLVRDII